ncbi:MAG: protein kinase domain-containing protein [Planctomycetota bacterium]|jgi:tetratricopeptide (TPR) repeat protein
MTLQYGPYSIVEELGSGGMGTVYLAERDDERVALKVVHEHLLAEPGVIKRFEREADVGAQITHDNVVRTLGAETAETEAGPAHFLVMEYVEGQTLRELLAEMETVPESLCRHIGREISAALSGIHSSGIIHRDLKPENVLITKEHVVKVMDLGLARLQSEAARLSQAGQFAGSVLYASPEQFTTGGDDLDGRSDLYALGLMLYELATGRHPFASDDLAAIMHRQIEEVPEPPSDVNPELSPFFDELVGGLLAKDRDQRFGDAVELTEIFGRGEESAWWRERAPEPHVRPRHVPRETKLYGREDLLAQMLAKFEQGGVLLLEGEAGVGKTRLVDEMLDRVESAHYLFGGYPPGGAATKTGAFLEAFAEVRGRLPRLLPDSPMAPSFAALLDGAPPPAGSEPLSKDGLQAVIARTASALAREKPLVLCIDDLHFAPDEGRALFASLAAAVRDEPILLIGTTRPGLPEAWLSELERLPQTTRVPVPRLGPKDLHGLLTDALQSERLAQELGGQIAWKSDGNPFFVFEILQGLRSGGLLRQERDTWVRTGVIESLEVPSSVRDLIHARIANLEEEDRQILELAACLGFEFDPTVVGEALGLPRIPMLRRLAQLERKHRLVHNAGRIYRFDHHQVQETLYEDLGELLREEYHAVLGELLEARGADSVVLATHYLRGGRGEQALPHLVPALEAHEEQHRNSAAIDLAQRALAIDGLLTCETRSPVLEKKANRENVIGRYEDAEESFLQWIHCAEGLDRQAAQIQLANLYVNQARYDGAIEACRAALEWSLENDQAYGETGSRLILANALLYLGRYEECIDEYEKAVAASKRIEDRDDAMARGGAPSNLGWAYGCVGRYREAIELSDYSMEKFEDEAWGLAIGGNYRIVFFRDIGDHARAHEAGEIVMKRILDMGYRWGEATALQELGVLALDEGRVEDARTLWNDALAIRRELGERYGTAETLAWLGRLDEDDAALREAIEIAREIDTPSPYVLAAAKLGEPIDKWLPRTRQREAIEALVGLGRLDEARAILARWDVGDRSLLENVPVFRGLVHPIGQ